VDEVKQPFSRGLYIRSVDTKTCHREPIIIVDELDKIPNLVPKSEYTIIVCFPK
jgi:hypothetical protein